MADNMFVDLTNRHLDNHWQNWTKNQTILPPHFALYSLTPHQNQPDYPKVVVCVSLQGMSLQLSYFIEKKDWLIFADFNQQDFVRKDYLWEENCLECFIELNNQSSYFETNVSPNGAYNFYHFDDYRTPNVMPPRQEKHLQLLQNNPNLVDNWYEKHLNIQINHYFAEFAQQGIDVCQITKINPTVILYQNNQPIFYAINHANPPDFHDKHHWINF